MAVWDWFLGLFKDDGTLKLDAYCGELAGEIFYKELAVQACVNLIANAVARSEFLTYEKGKEKKGENYYLFNVEPNQNKSSSKFWRDVIHKLVYHNECLVIQQDEKFYVADSFDPVKFAFKENIYKNIVIEDYKLKDTYKESQVFHFELHDEKIRTVIDGLYASYSKLIIVSSANYKKNNARRGTLEIPTSYPQTDKAQKDLNELLTSKFKRFFEAEGGAVLPLTNNMKYDELESNIGKKSGADGKDIRAFIDDIFDFVAIALQVPPQLLKGNVSDTDKAVNNFLTFCVNPIAELLTDEINRKLYGKKLYLERTYVKLDTSRIKAVDIKDIANALDILTRIGAYSVDDSLRALGMEPLETEWSKAKWMTKNYERIEQRYKGAG
ncbi:phage portal protein, HK97 family [Natronincola peptidivorans]|uniref:Phage portal protein, HK97 family n=1 Tax=Natronincola peptidivorans TaxID=426128 RepID=A0A1I0FEH4_9FIRM|nr:phage portal protein [Natronincola peptidivorans]SET55755.1 phage portal protein, HK97 family [Natronincola peptidivorans]